MLKSISLGLVPVLCTLVLLSPSAFAQATGCDTLPVNTVRVDHMHGDLSSELMKYNGQAIRVVLGPDVDAQLDTRGKGLSFPCLDLDADANGFGNGNAVLHIKSLGGLQSQGYLYLFLTDRVTVDAGAFVESSFDSVTINSFSDKSSWNDPASFRGLRARVVQFGNGTSFNVNPDIFRVLKFTEVFEMWSTPLSDQTMKSLSSLASSRAALTRINFAWYQAEFATAYCNTNLSAFLWTVRHHDIGMHAACL